MRRAPPCAMCRHRVKAEDPWDVHGPCPRRPRPVGQIAGPSLSSSAASRESEALAVGFSRHGPRTVAAEEIRASRRALGELVARHRGGDPEGRALALRLIPGLQGTLPDPLATDTRGG